MRIRSDSSRRRSSTVRSPFAGDWRLRDRTTTSFHRSEQPVAHIIAEQFPATAQLAVAATVVAVGLGIPLGMVRAVHRTAASTW